MSIINSNSFAFLYEDLGHLFIFFLCSLPLCTRVRVRGCVCVGGGGGGGGDGGSDGNEDSFPVFSLIKFGNSVRMEN